MEDEIELTINILKNKKKFLIDKINKLKKIKKIKLNGKKIGINKVKIKVI